MCRITTSVHGDAMQGHVSEAEINEEREEQQIVATRNSQSNFDMHRRLRCPSCVVLFFLFPEFLADDDLGLEDTTFFLLRSRPRPCTASLAGVSPSPAAVAPRRLLRRYSGCFHPRPLRRPLGQRHSPVPPISAFVCPVPASPLNMFSNSCSRATSRATLWRRSSPRSLAARTSPCARSTSRSLLSATRRGHHPGRWFRPVRPPLPSSPRARPA